MTGDFAFTLRAVDDLAGCAQFGQSTGWDMTLHACGDRDFRSGASGLFPDFHQADLPL